MSATNNQSIQQINTAALRGTREAHQPDEFDASKIFKFGAINLRGDDAAK